MNKEEFILQVKRKLKNLPNEEKEEEVIKEIEKPSEIASQIMANYIVK